MSKKEYPKVIVTCIDVWRDDAGANTLPNFFSDWDPDKVAVVYTKAALPDTKLCNSFFQISENEIMRAALHPGRKCGKVVYNEHKSTDTETKQNKVAVDEESKRYNFFRSHNLSIFKLAREFLWSLGAWKSKQFDEYLKSIDADVIFFPIYPYAYMNKIQSYIAKKTGLRGVAYIADDNYSYRAEWYNPMFWIRRFFLRKSIDEVMKYCDELLVILPKLKEEYADKFDLPIDVLTKGISIDCEFEKTEKKLPLKMVYTGNLFIGRDKSIVKVVDAIKKINQNGTRIELDIYSHIQLSKKLKKKLNVEGCSSFKGAVPISEVQKIQNEADIVLFVEGLDAFNKNKARLSFSTKLTDYFKSGKCIFAVGPANIAPIDYLSENQAAVVATSKKEIYDKLLDLVENTEVIDKYGEQAYALGKREHSNEKMKDVFYRSLMNNSRKKHITEK